MTNRFLFLIVFFLFFDITHCLVKGQSNHSGAGIYFQESLSWQQVLAKAKQERKYIFVDVFATWCGPCKQMDRTVYVNDRVGQFFNEHFISVKVQMDSTANDNKQVQSWYRDARMIEKAYRATSYPSYLFFSPDGQLAHRDVGVQNAEEFIGLGKNALDPARQISNNLSAYRKGQKNYSVMSALLNYAEQTKSKALADSLRKDYLAYIKQLPEKELLTEDRIWFVYGNSNNFTSKDRIFRIAYSEPQKIDEMGKRKGMAESIVHTVIIKEDLVPALWKENKPLSIEPDWAFLQKQVLHKYPNVVVSKIINNNYKIGFYKKARNWAAYARLVEADITSNPPPDTSKAMDVFFRLNMRAWDVFLDCTDTAVLQQALAWSELSIKLEPNVQYPDTRANLLYKLGRVNEAIAAQQDAYLADQALAKKNGKKYVFRYIGENLEKMKKGIPTWNQ